MFAEQRYLNRAEAAEFLSERGYKTAKATLAKRAVIGGGPPFISWGRQPLYDPADLLAWAERRCTMLRRSTSDRGTPECRENRGDGIAEATTPEGGGTPLAESTAPIDSGRHHAPTKIGKSATPVEEPASCNPASPSASAQS